MKICILFVTADFSSVQYRRLVSTTGIARSRFSGFIIRMNTMIFLLKMPKLF
ncbi:MAG: hypothetical protein M9926_00585 [Lentimicrobium sp.]|uniref:hypothetical protein n=1 Tax=Lentimicrobium sp. TaxID=2034841 RepID=UPI0025F6F5C4|nr:hypothetical protein [Lentimicrobium sp.]MCO5255228.1 hypothetical protein [Lentimicrobium sp.]